MPAKLKAGAVEYLVVHCSATPAKMKVDRNMIDRWHREKGWLGIGYHYVIRRDGVLEQGRPITDVGAHVEGFNEKSLGICMAGGVDDQVPPQPQDNFTPEQYATLAGLLYTLLIQFPRARICGHNELNPHKACPSFDVPKWWHETVVDPQVDK